MVTAVEMCGRKLEEGYAIAMKRIERFAGREFRLFHNNIEYTDDWIHRNPWKR